MRNESDNDTETESKGKTDKPEMFFVETAKTTYLCERVRERGTLLRLVNAVPVDRTKADPLLAQEYVKAKLLGRMMDVDVPSAMCGTITDAVQLQPMVQALQVMIPAAKQAVEGRLIFDELLRMSGGAKA
jgi:hypothetical protein